MNPRCPTVTLSVVECERLRAIVTERGEAESLRFVGLRSPETLYRAVAGVPISRLTAVVIRASLDRI